MRTVYTTPKRVLPRLPSPSLEPPVSPRSSPVDPPCPAVSAHAPALAAASIAPPHSAFASPLPPTPTLSPTTALPIPPHLLPPGMTARLLSALADARRRGYGGRVEEIRLRADRYATLTVGGYNCPTDLLLHRDTLSDILIHLCGGSLYAYSDTIHQGYVSLPGGIRVGVAGRATCEEGHIIGVTDISGLSIRIPHPHRAVGGTVCRLLRHFATRGEARGVLIYAPPGVGKTTLLRAVSAAMASGSSPWRTVVVDTRGELGFDCDRPELCLDILTGYPRARGVEIATRTLSAQLIICDEIGDVEEAMALISAHHGGVPLVASAHAGSVEELLRRTGIRLLHEARLFGAYVGIRRVGGEAGSVPLAPWPLPERRMPETGVLAADASSPWSEHAEPLGAAARAALPRLSDPPCGSVTAGQTGVEIPPNHDFHHKCHHSVTTDPPRATIAKNVDFSRGTSKWSSNVQAEPSDQPPRAKGGPASDATDDYLYRITPWTDADRLTGGA